MRLHDWDVPDIGAAPDEMELLAVSRYPGEGLELETTNDQQWPFASAYLSSWDTHVLLDAYRHGLFPMPLDEPIGVGIGWWSPNPRCIFTSVSVSKSLRSSMRRFAVTTDVAFENVIDACANPDRPHGWIDASVRQTYVALHEQGDAHSIEVWADGNLVGGLYGLAIGGLFAGESMFHVQRDASKVALVHLVTWWTGHGGVVDSQWPTDHLLSMGAREIPRSNYVEMAAQLTSEQARPWPVPGPFA